MAGLVLSPAPGSWATVLSQGQPPFWFAAQFMGPPADDGTLRLGVDVGGLYDTTVVGEAHIVLPAGLALVQGDTLICARLAAETRVRTIVVRPVESGSHVIRGLLTVDNRHRGIDEGEIEVGVTVAPDTVILGACKTVRQERVRGGRRYRFGGGYMVPIDASQRVTQYDILVRGERPRVLRQQTAVCSKSEALSRQAVPWVVFVGKDGRVRDASPIAVTPRDSAAVRITRAALASWSFTPAKANGEAVIDWIVVQVPIEQK